MAESEHAKLLRERLKTEAPGTITTSLCRLPGGAAMCEILLPKRDMKTSPLSEDHYVFVIPEYAKLAETINNLIAICVQMKQEEEEVMRSMTLRQ